MRRLNCTETRTCKQCGCTFSYNAIPSKKSGGLFCSGACQRKGRKQRLLYDSFNKRVGATTNKGCILWNGSLDENGYGRLGRQLAHRISYEINIGPIPDSGHVLHECDNPRCINPAHLFLGNNFDNIADKLSKNRQAKGEMFNKKLNEDNIQEIRRAHQAGATQAELAKRFDVNQSLISRIVHRKIWRHL